MPFMILKREVLLKPRIMRTVFEIINTKKKKNLFIIFKYSSSKKFFKSIVQFLLLNVKMRLKENIFLLGPRTAINFQSMVKY